MNAHELREAFLRFFEERGHRRLPSAPLVPAGDPTLLFTSAGMVQFKPHFMGQAKPPHTRLTTVQKCFRTSDIESVGDTSHLTFFEMLGNFSIGDYFKAEVIPWAWDFVTKVLKLEAERLWPAVYLDDDESYELWQQVGVPAERIRRYGEEHNYWFSGEVGPCGPCSEIYYDFGEQFGCGPQCEPSHDCGRFLEIWNLVFMSYFCDGEKREPLPSRNIDTGSGFERVMAALLFQSKGWDKTRLPSVYDTELFRPIIARIEELCGKRYGEDPATDRAMRIVAEHSRAVTFLIGDERTPVVPSNEGRGYVVRRLLRRAVYFGRRYLEIDDPFLDRVADEVIASMRKAYPEIERQAVFLLRAIQREEEQVSSTMGKGQLILAQGLGRMYGWLARYLGQLADRPWLAADEPPLANGFTSTELPEPIKQMALRPVIETLGEEPWKATSEQWQRARQLATVLPGEVIFTLWDTYGIPAEITNDIASGLGLSVDEAGFQQEMERQRERARASAGGAETVAADALYASLASEATAFLGYETLETQTKVVALLVGRRDRSSDLSRVDLKVGPYEVVETAEAGDEVQVLLAETPFYPEGGGQVGDRGEIAGPSGWIAVEDTQRVAERVIVHRGRVVEGRIAAGDEVTARVDPRHRADTMRNHTATHLLHAALRQVLGTHVRQAGSLVAPDHLRFDFTHTEALTEEQIAEVESLVNEKVRQDLPVQTRTTSFDEAMSEGALAFFGDKYGETVRVVEVNSVGPRFSAELCGGTHCHHTGEIGVVVVTGESSIGSGMRRIEALTGRAAAAHIRQQQTVLSEMARRLGAPRELLPEKVDALLLAHDALEKTLEKLQQRWARLAAKELLDNIQEVGGIRLLLARIDAQDLTPEGVRYFGDSIRDNLTQTGGGVAVVGYAIDGKPGFLALATADAVSRGVHAGNLIKRVASVAGGSGGGRPDMAQGGGKDLSKIDEALASVPDAVREMLGGKRQGRPT